MTTKRPPKAAPVAGGAQLFRALPAVERCLQSPPGKTLVLRFGPGVTGFFTRVVLAELRSAIRSGQAPKSGIEDVLAEVERRAAAFALPAGRRALNATGILLHTGLGRAPLGTRAAATLGAMDRFSVLEVDRASGERSRRDNLVESILCDLVGCEAAMVVNNNAAATFLVLHTVAAGKAAIISRGQLIEIGGSYRMPDVMGLSGARLHEVGTTNKTHLSDYERAISDDTGVLVHVHTSNYRIHGFASTPSIAELSGLARSRGIPLFDDLGSGALIELSRFGLPEESLVSGSLRSGADIVCFSGDKLLGGPQCGIICGSSALIERMRKNPFTRMFRVDKLTLGALEQTLAAFLNGASDVAELPLYRLMSASRTELEERAARCSAALAPLPGFTVAVIETRSYVGGGSLPEDALPSVAISIGCDADPRNVERLAAQLRSSVPAVFGRLQDGRLVLDLRAIAEDEVEELAAIVRAAAETGRPVVP